MNIGDKILAIMHHYGYKGHNSQKRFSDDTRILPQNLNAITSGKTKNPGIDVAVKIKKAFPQISLDWLIMDKGAMEASASKASAPPIDFSEKLKADSVLQAKVIELENLIKDKDKLITTQEMLIKLLDTKVMDR